MPVAVGAGSDAIDRTAEIGGILRAELKIRTNAPRKHVLWNDLVLWRLFGLFHHILQSPQSSVLIIYTYFIRFILGGYHTPRIN